jgi:hypothetical protein
MNTAVKYIFIAAAILVLLLLAWWSGFRYNAFESKKTESAVVMLEKVKKVTKLIAVEGSFTELYDYKDHYQFDFFNLFSKKALLRVTAKVSVGFDFEKLNISFDSISRTVSLNELPEASILSIDHDLDYYDISQGTFNKFTHEEYNMINKKAKALIEEKALSAKLIEQADQQKEDFIMMLEMALSSIGWKLVIKPHQLAN